MNLKEALQTLAANFAAEVLAAVRGASLDELLGETGSSTTLAATVRAPSAESAPSKSAKAGRPAKAGRLARRSIEQIQEAAAGVAKLLQKEKDGLRAEDIRKALELDKREVPRILQQGLADKLFRIIGGAKRATTYGVGKAKAKPAKAKPRKAAEAKAVKTKPARKAKAAKPRKAKAAPKKAASKRAPKVSAKTNHAPVAEATAAA